MSIRVVRPSFWIPIKPIQGDRFSWYAYQADRLFSLEIRHYKEKKVTNVYQNAILPEKDRYVSLTKGRHLFDPPISHLVIKSLIMFTVILPLVALIVKCVFRFLLRDLRVERTIYG